MKSFRQTPFRATIAPAVLFSLVVVLGIMPWRVVAAEAAELVADKPPVKSDLVQLTPGQEKILHTLHQPAGFEFIQTPLEQIVHDAQDRHKIDVRLDDKALRAAGTERIFVVVLAVAGQQPIQPNTGRS